MKTYSSSGSRYQMPFWNSFIMPDENGNSRIIIARTMYAIGCSIAVTVAPILTFHDDEEEEEDDDEDKASLLFMRAFLPQL
jgi:DNA repair photolyase